MYQVHLCRAEVFHASRGFRGFLYATKGPYKGLSLMRGKGVLRWATTVERSRGQKIRSPESASDETALGWGFERGVSSQVDSSATLRCSLLVFGPKGPLHRPKSPREADQERNFRPKNDRHRCDPKHGLWGGPTRKNRFRAGLSRLWHGFGTTFWPFCEEKGHKEWLKNRSK